MRLSPFADAPAPGGWKGLVHRRLSMGVRVVLTIAGWAGSGERAAGCGRCKWPPRLDFAQFKRRKQGNRQACGTERPVLSVYQGRRRTVKNPRTPAAGGGAPERWRPRRPAAAWRTKPLCDGPSVVVAAEDGPPGWSRRRGPLRIGVVRAMARSGHWRWVSTPG